MIKIVFDGISKSFCNDENEKKIVLTDFNLTLTDSDFFTIVGPNACGKSTLLNLMAGIIKPDTGTIKITLSNKHKPRIGYVWQDYRSTLLPWLNVSENITFPLRLEGHPKSERLSISKKILNDLNLDINYNEKAYQLSGGQQQLLCLLRSTVIKPDLLLLDEPFSALDQLNRWSMAFRIESIWLDLKIPTFFVSHDIDEAILLADKILLMNSEGKIEKQLSNNLMRPRNVKMLTSSTHVNLRQKVIEFLFQQGAIQETFSKS